MALPTVTGEFGIVGTPELRFSNDGKPWMKIRGVAKSRKRGANGAWTDGESTFIDIIVFDVLATNLTEQNLAQGDSITVTGRLAMREWEQDGQKRTTYQITADSIGMSVRWKHYGSGAAMNVDDVKASLGAEQLEDVPF
jgi:single-strand DNA-binding protein